MNRFMVAALLLTASSAGLAQGSESPATDARGIPVVSSPATPPTGANQTVTVPSGATVRVTPDQSAVFTPTAASDEVPACSKTVTDRCIQTYEGRGGAKAMGHHQRMHRKHKMRHKKT